MDQSQLRAQVLEDETRISEHGVMRECHEEVRSDHLLGIGIFEGGGGQESGLVE